MRPWCFLCLLALSLAGVARAQSFPPLPDSCGSDSITFNVTRQKDPPPLSAPTPGKAQIVFLEDLNSVPLSFTHATVRFGLDGAWAGATHDNSYFAFTVDPGLHHLCANWQGSTERERVHLLPFTAEPGKVYYFSANITLESKEVVTFALTQLNEDEARYQLNFSDLAVAKPRKKSAH